MKRILIVLVATIAICLVLAATGSATTPQSIAYSGRQTPSSAPNSVTGTRNLTSMPLAFTQNNGQWDEQVSFRANAGGATMWFSSDGAYYQFTRTISKDEPQAGPVDPANLMEDRMDHQWAEYLHRRTTT